jgi:TonB family protein
MSSLVWTAAVAAPVLLAALILARWWGRLSGRAAAFLLLSAYFLPLLAAPIAFLWPAAAVPEVLPLVYFPEQAGAAPAPLAVEASGGFADLAGLVMIGWGAVASLLLTRVLFQAIRWEIRSFRAKDTRLPLAILRLMEGDPLLSRLRVRVSSAVEAPTTAGLWRPAILLPPGWGESVSRDELRAVLVHEAAHVGRHDNAVAFAIAIVRSLLFFDPFRWMAEKEFYRLREIACDEAVLERGCNPEHYIAALARACGVGAADPAVACVAGSGIARRMEGVMTYLESRHRLVPERRVRLAAVLMGLLAAVGLSSLIPVPAVAQSASDSHTVRAKFYPTPQGGVLARVAILDADGTLMAEPRIELPTRSTPATLSSSVTTSSGEVLSYRTLVKPREEGGGSVEVEVFRGDALTETIAVDVSVEESAPLAAPVMRSVTLSAQNMELREAIRQIASQAGLQIALDPGLEGKVTASFVDLPGSVALSVVLNPLGLGLDRSGDGYRVYALPPLPPGYHRVGAGVDPPRVLTRVDPIYPAEARAMRIQGIVVVNAFITDDGVIESAEVIKGLPGLDPAALDAVRQWTFVPAMKDGVPVPVVYNVTINFRLD